MQFMIFTNNMDLAPALKFVHWELGKTHADSGYQFNGPFSINPLIIVARRGAWKWMSSSFTISPAPSFPKGKETR